MARVRRSRLRYRAGNVAVRYSDTLDKIARNAVEKVQPGLLGLLESEYRPVFSEAKDEWPVKTGRSRRHLELETTLDPSSGEVGMGIRNDLPYAIFIRPKKLFGATTAWQRYVRGPVHKIRQALPNKIVKNILANLRTRGGK